MGQQVTKKVENVSKKSEKMTNFDTPKQEIQRDSRDTIKERDRPSWEEDFELESRRIEHGIGD